LKISERRVEEYLRNQVKKIKGIAYKFTSPARRSVPDRLVLLPIPPEHRTIVEKYVIFVEAKATGKKATDAQVREHTRLRTLGFKVEVVDSHDSVDETIAAARVPGDR